MAVACYQRRRRVHGDYWHGHFESCHSIASLYTSELNTCDLRVIDSFARKRHRRYDEALVAALRNLPYYINVYSSDCSRYLAIESFRCDHGTRLRDQIEVLNDKLRGIG